MKPHIADLLPGEELTDRETFLAFLSSGSAAPADAEGAPRLEPPRAAQPATTTTAAGPRRRLAPPIPSPPVRPAGRPVMHRVPLRPSSSAAVAALEAEIDACSSRDHVVRLAVHLARAYAAAVALFVVHRGLVERICSDGLASSGAGLLFPVDAPNLFGRVVASGEAFRGVPPQDALDRRIFRVLGRRQVQEIAVLPVAIRGRVASLLYADNGPEALGDASVAALTAVCARVSRAYERLILERKRA